MPLCRAERGVGRRSGGRQAESGSERLLNNVIKVATKCIKQASNVGSKAKHAG